MAAREARVRALVAAAAHHLPAQGPIGVFVHHNPLHAFQHLPFEEAVVVAGRLYDAEPYMTEAQYREARDRGRITDADLDAVLAAEVPHDPIAPGLPSRRALGRALLDRPLCDLRGDALVWHLDEEEGLPHPSDGSTGPTRATGRTGPEGEDRARAALWTSCEARAAALDGPAPPDGPRPRRGHPDVDRLVVRWCAAFLDQGLAYWPMPDRERGFLGAVRALLTQPFGVDPEGLPGLTAAFRRQGDAPATRVIVDALLALGVPEDAWGARLEDELLALPGWSGLMHVIEERPAAAPHGAPPCALVDLLAVRLTAARCARRAPPPPAASAPHDPRWRAFRLFEIARRLDLGAREIDALPAGDLRRLFAEADAFDDVTRRRLWHLAYERRHRQEVLTALARHLAAPPPALPSPRHQVFFCIDEREESMRRHLEEVGPAFETWGAAGFYGVAMTFRGHDDEHGAPLCPVAVTPTHEVTEEPVPEARPRAARRAALRRRLARLGHGALISSRTLARGWLVTGILGLIAFVPLAGRVFFPRAVAGLRALAARLLVPPPPTRLALTRSAEGGADRGFTIEEAVARVGAVLRQAGLTEGHAPLVTVIGHGSSSLNNPHESAHDCGACGGRRGGPNARAFAAMANLPAVRDGLRAQGITIPETTWFLGGYHDTCSDAVVFFDLDAVPAGHRELVGELRRGVEEARRRSAHERCRRFEAAPRGRSTTAALRHVEGRAEHLGEPRPEYGHCTNAVCIVGRRRSTRGLFLDRRAFLVSYDPFVDDEEGRLLEAVLAAVGPVGAGINLEYYFSFVDNERYGCGTKLPHNVTGLVGVMNGPASDLRTGLPWQMVEIHEPVRLLTLLEVAPERAARVVARHAATRQLVENRWIQLATLHPTTREIHVYEGGRFVPFVPEPGALPEVDRSLDWYEGRIDHLPVARVRAALAEVA